MSNPWYNHSYVHPEYEPNRPYGDYGAGHWGEWEFGSRSADNILSTARDVRRLAKQFGLHDLHRHADGLFALAEKMDRSRSPVPSHVPTPTQGPGNERYGNARLMPQYGNLGVNLKWNGGWERPASVSSHRPWQDRVVSEPIPVREKWSGSSTSWKGVQQPKNGFRVGDCQADSIYSRSYNGDTNEYNNYDHHDNYHHHNDDYHHRDNSYHHRNDDYHPRNNDYRGRNDSYHHRNYHHQSNKAPNSYQSHDKSYRNYNNSRYQNYKSYNNSRYLNYKHNYNHNQGYKHKYKPYFNRNKYKSNEKGKPTQNASVTKANDVASAPIVPADSPSASNNGSPGQPNSHNLSISTAANAKKASQPTEDKPSSAQLVTPKAGKKKQARKASAKSPLNKTPQQVAKLSKFKTPAFFKKEKASPLATGTQQQTESTPTKPARLSKNARKRSRLSEAMGNEAASSKAPSPAPAAAFSASDTPIRRNKAQTWNKRTQLGGATTQQNMSLSVRAPSGPSKKLNASHPSTPPKGSAVEIAQGSTSRAVAQPLGKTASQEERAALWRVTIAKAYARLGVPTSDETAPKELDNATLEPVDVIPPEPEEPAPPMPEGSPLQTPACPRQPDDGNSSDETEAVLQTVDTSCASSMEEGEIREEHS